ncbi:PD-(D/E)XK nuclease-like domain-containing protein [Hymenobacter sp. 15J16-1T3B]|uniref:PD-(D/E)XK nuclease-like domain-containing protein n=1 Tax=Hymenobacter sp. 15J16-1T3B TaxID=2886941 RepID=UPI001D119E14|nr:PD-(D/E)XK nuclease-like domain-containing protein [Hymenobacter sp. 15J16-1T3B]MCC3160510.1 PD-(D/E)XK nuclease-like domain-containing protein [Hymenobacter sp. 15J16-1T3B]
MSDTTPPAPWRRPDLLRLSYDDYRALPAIANSDLSRLRDALNGRPRRESSGSSALSFGTAFHTALLEPDQYVPAYPAVNDTLVWWLVEGVRLRDDLRELLDNGVAEPSCIFTEPITGTMCKLRADLVVDVPGQPYTVIDFKTTLARDYHHFVAQCTGYDYDRQAAFYLDALRADRFILVGVQKQPPHHLFVFEVPPHMLEEGRAKYLRLLRLLDPAKLPDYLDPAVRDVVVELGHTPPEQEDDPAPAPAE